MNTNQLKDKLASDDARERLEAARFLAANPDKSHKGIIQDALAVETVIWIKRALQRAAQSIGLHTKQPVVPKSVSSDLDERLARQIYSYALETTTSQIIHEIEPILGSIKMTALREIENYEKSETARLLNRLGELTDGLSRLRKAASSPRFEELTLDIAIAEWVEKIVGEKQGELPFEVLQAGQELCVVEGDKGLISLAFTNGLRNAIEATLETREDRVSDQNIVIRWGITDVDHWIVIIDQGKGFTGNTSSAFEIGTTTKADHLGMGLATAEQALASMDGTVRLVPLERGVRFEMRWPKRSSLGD